MIQLVYFSESWLWSNGRKVNFLETPPSVIAANNIIFPYEQQKPCGKVELLRPNDTTILFGLMQQECTKTERALCKISTYDSSAFILPTTICFVQKSIIVLKMINVEFMVFAKMISGHFIANALFSTMESIVIHVRTIRNDEKENLHWFYGVYCR